MDEIEKKEFYDNESEKIKFNWFCYEYANNLYYDIKLRR